MDPVNLFDLASKQARWLSVRQAAIAGNIANVNTPGFVASDVEPFEKVLKKSPEPMGITNASHMALGGGDMEVDTRLQETDIPTSPSGNSVSVEDELVKAGEVRRAFELNTAIVKSFHRMFLMTAKP